MRKQKSVKLRIFIALQALFKCTDERHGLNSVILNEFLKPYNLDCKNTFLRSTAEDLRTFGVDVQRKNGLWVKNHPFTEEKFQKLLFAVSTNPYLSKDEVTEILQNLKPFVTIYQEEYLEGAVDTNTETDGTLYKTFYMLQKAIRTNKTVKYTTSVPGETKRRMFYKYSPKAFYHAVDGLYVTGYNHTLKKEQSVKLNAITAVKENTKETFEESKYKRMLETFTPGYNI